MGFFDGIEAGLGRGLTSLADVLRWKYGIDERNKEKEAERDKDLSIAESRVRSVLAGLGEQVQENERAENARRQRTQFIRGILNSSPRGQEILKHLPPDSQVEPRDIDEVTRLLNFINPAPPKPDSGATDQAGLRWILSQTPKGAQALQSMPEGATIPTTAFDDLMGILNPKPTGSGGGGGTSGSAADERQRRTMVLGMVDKDVTKAEGRVNEAKKEVDQFMPFLRDAQAGVKIAPSDTAGYGSARETLRHEQGALDRAEANQARVRQSILTGEPLPLLGTETPDFDRGASNQNEPAMDTTGIPRLDPVTVTGGPQPRRQATGATHQLPDGRDIRSIPFAERQQRARQEAREMMRSGTMTPEQAIKEAARKYYIGIR